MNNTRPPDRDTATMAVSGTPWMRLSTLLETRQGEILSREQDNSCRIYLYDTAGWWVAFEQSACQLSRIFPDCGITILHLRKYPFPVVMASVADRQVQAYSHSHIFRTSSAGIRVLSATQMAPECYSRWHRETVDGLI